MSLMDDPLVNELSNKYGKNVMEEQAQPVVFANAEQIAELKTLLENWKSPENWESKTLDAAKAEKWEEVDTAKMTTIINFIKSKLTKTEK